MSAYRAALLALVVVGGALVAAAPATGTPLHAVDDRASANGDDFTQTDESVRATGAQSAAQNESRNNTSLGGDISSFMQSSAAETSGAVETGMWTAAYNGTDNQTVRARLVDRQTADLREELTELQERKAELVDERNATDVSEVAYKASLGQLVGRINALKAAINATEVRARETNTSVAAVAELRTDSENLTGPEVASVARNVTGVGVADGDRGPPGAVGNANGVTGPANGTTSLANATGQPTDVGNATGNQSQRGPPADANALLAQNESTNMTSMPNASGTATPNASGSLPATAENVTTTR